MPQPRNHIPREEWRRIAQVLLARKDAFTYAEVAEDMGVTRRMVNTRVSILSKQHGTMSALVARTKRGATETYRLTGRGAVVCRALAAGRAVTPRPVEPPRALSKWEADYRALRATLGLPVTAMAE